ncbi:unnamed protein product [Taenia asiatica]|uniref:Uncharacterized protein n=1 Tax=Taenia asiatica TaxID=60517 RepID=A0A3P6QP52_TAEAS|nr:unnamed protein product [Taenia asiatica]
MDNLSIEIRPGTTVAIVGPSGSGKSTTIQLIQRFYDTVSGEVLIDGKNIKELDLKWFRGQIGVVQQEPVLFSGTIAENIALGRPNATEEEIEAAAKMADAHNFILKLPQAYNTPILEGGGSMSGGQKQRIAIARALIRNPKILLLDEATSALDTRSERTVQNALDRACSGRTVVVVAHRLTTVRNADKIVVMDRGRVQEIGTHDQLVALKGIYAKMLSSSPGKRAEDTGAEEAETDTEEEEAAAAAAEDEMIDRPRWLSRDELRKPSMWMLSQRWSDAETMLEALTEMSGTEKTSKMKGQLVRALKLNRPEFPYLFLGLFLSLASGLSQPAFAILYSEMFGIFSQNTTPEEKLAQTAFYAGMMAVLGLARFITQLLSGCALGYAGAELTKRARSLLFKAMLRQEIGWFDRVENSPGILTARLATEVSALETVTGTQLGTLMEASSLIIASLVIGFTYSWILSLVNLCFVPLLIVFSALQMNQMVASLKPHEVEGSQVMQEALTAERTVTSFGLESHFYSIFSQRSAPESIENYKEALMYALVNGVASSLTIFQACASFYVGAVLLSQGKITVLAVFRTYSAYSFGSQALGRVASLAPEFRKASHNVKLVFATLDRKTKSDPNEGDFPEEAFDGRIEFHNIYFRYPTRPNTRILRRFSHTVEADQSVALVGQSGCGKSTILQLVQRFYDVSERGPNSGIFINGRDVRTLAPNWIRRQIGVVSQEPNLFDLSIRENIAYGDNSREVSIAEIIAAAKEANAHSFIETLPELIKNFIDLDSQMITWVKQGYETPVGARGSQLSGGQKQRIAIARALVRKPKLLLLDEATSALDNESERIVQAALDEAMAKGGRTSLVVAHRLTTVENCDVIVVLQEGQRVEYGRPAALMQARGVFYTLHNVDAAEGNEVDDMGDFGPDESERIRFYQLFRYSDVGDRIMLAVGVIFALAVGCSFPVNLVIFSKVINLLTNPSGKVDLNEMRVMVGWFCLLGVVTLILAFIELFNFSYSARRQSRRIRLKLFKQILRQDVPWFDRQSLGDLITKLTANVEQIETGIGERLGRFIQNAAMFISCYVCAFINNWKIALVGLSAAPLIVLAFSIMGLTMSNFALKEQKAYSKANNVASEVFNAIKTVFAFIGQEKEKARYSSQLGAAAKVSFLKNVMLGFGIGLIGGSIFASAGLTFWFGVKEHIDHGVESGTIVSVVLAFIVGSIALGLVLPEFSYFTRATAAASSTYWIIERVPEIDKEASGIQLNDVKGSIEFRNVSFAYPMRPDVVTLKNFSMKIDAGQTIAIVGPSGSGKSTVIQLLQRFYDPIEGQVLIDGYDIRELDLKWMRRQFGVVSQEPVLFAATVKENIKMGREDASFEDIETAAKLADAHDFITGMQDEYDTMIGEGGGGMSGGQKQRLAIARALLRNPRILLLDEATSALDTHSERAVQDALDRAGVGRTVIMVAHRLTTVRNADCILVVDGGVVKESGTHDELVAFNGIYANMLSSQEKKKETTESDSEPEEEPEKPKTPKQSGVWKRTSRDAETESTASSTTMTAMSLFQSVNNTALGWAGAKLTQRTRSLLFNAILKQEPGWFDEIANQPGVLTARLATEVSSLETVTGAQLGTIMESICLIIASLVITFMYSWQLTLVNICFLPIMVASSALQMKNLRSVMNIREVAGSQVVQESLSAEKTVFAFGLEDYFYNKFVEKSDSGNAQRVKDCLLYGLVHGIANALSYFQSAASFYVGAVLMNNNILDVLAVFRTFSAFNFGAQGLTRVAALTPDFKKASDKIASVFATLDRQTKLDVTEGEYPSEPLSGSIVFKNVYFRYPTRKHVRVLRKFNYTVQAGNSVALVGASGCGKSTILQLVQRLYDVSPHGPGSGIFFDGHDIRTLAPNWIRQQIGIVSQEPNLFDLSIRENIAYGDNSREVSMDEIIEAAKEANVHEFVQNLPEVSPQHLTSHQGDDFTRTAAGMLVKYINREANTFQQGYETPVGARGSQLSGGQKQRIAIARALVRKPKLLLLDEATSALDNESERIVQAALDEAMAKGGRTSLVVAHRLTTVENCDVIVVLQEGQECEIGPPAGLMAAKGIYYQLHNVDAAVKSR